MKYLILILSLLILGFAPVDTLQNTFGHIRAYYKIKSKAKDNCIECYSTPEDSIKINILNEKFNKMAYIMASAFIVDHSDSETYLMTSGHVCKELEFFISNGKFKKLGIDLQGQIFIDNDAFKNKEIVEYYLIDQEIAVYSFEGAEYKIKDIKAVDSKKDICILSTYFKWGQKAEFANKNCIYEEVFNMSSSGGYYYPGSVPIRKGIINNVIKKQEYKDETFYNVNLYTLMVKPGSSGSAVFNKEGKVCGSINISYSKLDLSSGASRIDLINFFNKNIVKKDVDN